MCVGVETRRPCDRSEPLKRNFYDCYGLFSGVGVMMYESCIASLSVYLSLSLSLFSVQLLCEMLHHEHGTVNLFNAAE